MTAALAYACARAGHLERARTLLEQLLALAEKRYISPSLIAQVHAGSAMPTLQSNGWSAQSTCGPSTLRG